TARAPWARWREDRAGVELEADLERGARQFGTMRLSAITLGHTSSSVLGGKGWDEAVVSALSRTIGTEAVVTTNGLDSIAALRASGIRRPFLIMPPWFGSETLAAGLRYYADHGFAPAAHLR